MKKQKASTAGLKRDAVLCLLKHRNQLLLIFRHKEPNKYKYMPVGGKVEPHESPVNAAIRETLEEAGIKIENPKFCGVLVETSPQDYNWTVFVYLKEVEYFTPPACNEGPLQWINIDAITTLEIPETDKFIYQYVIENKTFMFNAEYDEGLNLVSMSEEIENKELTKTSTFLKS